MSYIELKNISKSFGEKEVIKNFDLSIDRGEFISLLGPSGCGKTTLLRMVAGFIDPTEGEIIIDGKTVFSSEKNIYVKTGKRNLGMVFQSYAVWPHMTVYENIAFGLRVRKMSNEEIHERVVQASEILGIKEYLDKKPKEMSGGQRQRVAIARAVAVHPDLVIADEPVVSLDVSMQAQIVTLFQQLQQEQGFSFLYISHDLAMVRYLCDRVGVMRSGRLVEEAEADELFAHPCHAYTRVLLSAMPEPDPRYERARTILSCHEEELGTTFEYVSPGHRVLR